MTRRVAAAAASVLALGVAAAALHWAGRGALAGPPLAHPGQWAAWLEGRDPAVAAFSLLRLLAVVGLWYLVAVTTIGTVLRLAGAASLVRIADRFTIAPVRRMLAGSVSLGLAASGVLAVAAPALRTPVAAATQQPAPEATPSTVTMHRLSPSETLPPLPPAVEPPVTPATATDRWTVKPGQCFWSIAESVLAERWGRAPTDAEIVPYWQRLIDANRHQLAHRDDPDLVFPGQVFVVPAP